MPRRDGARLAAVFLLLSAPAAAQPHSAAEPPGSEPTTTGETLAPGERYTGRWDLRLRTDSTLRTFYGRRPFTNIFGEVDFDLTARVWGPLSIVSVSRLEQQRAPAATSAFQFEAAYFQGLHARLDLDPLAMWAGKFHPRFGRAWDLGPGFYGRDFGYDYEQLEKLGGGASFTVNALGRHTLTAEIFTQDTSVLSRGIGSAPYVFDRGTYRPRRRHTDQGFAGNTGQLDSYDLVLGGEALPELPAALSYQVAYSFQPGSAGPGGIGQFDETAYAASLAWTGEVAPGWTLTPLWETAWQRNRFGTPADATITTVAMGVEAPGGWSGGVHAAIRTVGANQFAPKGTDWLTGFTVGNDLTESLFPGVPSWLKGLTFSVGYKAERGYDPAERARQTQHVVGTELRLGRRF